MPGLQTIMSPPMFVSAISISSNARLQSISFPLLQVINGTGTCIYVYGNAALMSVSFPSLTTVVAGPATVNCMTGIQVSQNSVLQSLFMPNLTFISACAALRVDFNALTNVSFPSLATITGYVTNGRQGVGIILEEHLATSLDFSSLQSIAHTVDPSFGGAQVTALSIERCYNIATLSLPSLVTVRGEISVIENGDMATVSMPVLANVSTTYQGSQAVTVQNNPSLNSVSLPALSFVNASQRPLDFVMIRAACVDIHALTSLISGTNLKSTISTSASVRIGIWSSTIVAANVTTYFSFPESVPTFSSTSDVCTTTTTVSISSSTAIPSSSGSVPIYLSIFTFNQFIWIVIGGVFFLCLFIGFTIPCCLCSRNRWRNSTVVLYSLSWVLPGLDVGSIAIMWHSQRKNPESWHFSIASTCVLGVFEFLFVVLCFPLAAVLDCVLLPNMANPNIRNSGVPFFLLLLAIPGYFGALLLIGLPRVLTMYNATTTNASSRRGRALESAAVAAVAAPIELTPTPPPSLPCNSCGTMITTKFCGNCGANNVCNSCGAFIGSFCSTCGIPAAQLNQNPHAQASILDAASPAPAPPLVSPIPPSKPALPPKPVKQQQQQQQQQQDHVLSYPPESMSMWVLTIILFAVSLIVMALCAAQINSAMILNVTLQDYARLYNIDMGKQWYPSVCLGVFTGIIGLLIGLLGFFLLLSKFALNRNLMIGFLIVTSLLAIFAFVFAILASVSANLLMNVRPMFFSGRSFYEQMLVGCASQNNFNREPCYAPFVILLILSAVFGFGLVIVSGIAIFVTAKTLSSLN